MKFVLVLMIHSVVVVVVIVVVVVDPQLAMKVLLS